MKQKLILSALVLVIASSSGWAQQVIYDNGPALEDGGSTTFSDLGDGEIVADDVTLNATTKISQISWLGAYLPFPFPPNFDNFVIEIYADSNGPFGNPLASFEVGNQVNRTPNGPFFSYSANIEFTMVKDVTYWVSIYETEPTITFVNGVPFQTEFALLTDNDPVGNSRRSTDSGATWVETDVNLAFTLGADPVFDNGVTAMSNNASFTSDDEVPVVYAADLILPVTTRVTRLEWSGQYGGPSDPATDNFMIEVFDGQTGLPSGTPLAQFPVGNDVNRTLVVPSGEYDYSASIDFTFDANVNYFIAIRELDTSNELNFRWNAQLDVGTSAITTNGGASWSSRTHQFDFTLFGAPAPLLMIVNVTDPAAVTFDTTSENAACSFSSTGVLGIALDDFFDNNTQTIDTPLVDNGAGDFLVFGAPDASSTVSLDRIFVGSFGGGFTTNDLNFYSTQGSIDIFAVAGQAAVQGSAVQDMTAFAGLPVAGDSGRVVIGAPDDEQVIGRWEVTSDPLLGDVNLDGAVNLLDVAPFVDLVSNGLFQPEADINEDGFVNLLDVAPFVAILSGG